MAEIVLATLNAKYIHASFGLRYLHANLGELRDAATILEFDIHQQAHEIAERILAHRPRILGLGVYIWNATPIRDVVALLRRIEPGLLIVLGGPEVSHETEAQALCGLADYVITGEADLAFASLCRDLLNGVRPDQKVIRAELPDVSHLASPYSLYTAEDIQSRIVYVEASRGCPFRCEFCLSSLAIPVRQFPLERFLADIDGLMQRGVRQFKFVDRTFNLSIPTSTAILRYFLERLQPGLFVHFELVPDRLPAALRDLIRQFPPGVLQFEVGVQTFNPEVADNISRRQDYQKLEENLQFLREHTQVHVHADLIAGLPGEDVGSFGAGFDRLFALGPQEIQVGILKRLRGTPISRHDQAWEMVYSAEPPYEILKNKLIDFPAMQRMRRFARYWDMVHNSGNFESTLPLLWAGRSPFEAFFAFSEWIYAETGRTSAISLTGLFELVHRYLRDVRQVEAGPLSAALTADHRRAGRSGIPLCLRSEIPLSPATVDSRPIPKRQARHLGTATASRE